MAKPFALMACAVMLWGGFSGQGFAGGAQAKVTVSARVVARVTQFILQQRSKIIITDEDIKRGFVEIPSGTILQVRTNAKKGYYLDFEGTDEFIKEVWVIDRGRTTVISQAGGLIHQPHPRANLEVKELSYKIYLRKNIQPGVYPWPLRVRASLL